jgi:hypothetical protein
MLVVLRVKEKSLLVSRGIFSVMLNEVKHLFYPFPDESCDFLLINFLNSHKISLMNTLLIDKKKYVLLKAKDYEALQVKAASKTEPVKKLTLQQGKKIAYKLIDLWAKGK